MIIFVKIHLTLKKLKSLPILNYLKKIDTIFNRTIVYEGLQYGGIQISVALLVDNK